MLGLITATVVTAMREKKGREAVGKRLAKHGVQDSAGMGMAAPMMDDGFGASDPLDSFSSNDPNAAAFDEDAFK
jgi:hypothetical protein